MLVVYIVFSFVHLSIWSLQIGWFKRFQNLIEEAVDRNHGQPAVLIAHSMGNLVTYYFMKQVLYRLNISSYCLYGHYWQRFRFCGSWDCCRSCG